MELYLNMKAKLYHEVLKLVGNKIECSQNNLNELRDSAGSEAKSSAGDKHETGRAMIHLEQEKTAKQLGVNIKLQQLVSYIDPSVLHDKVELGALVITDKLRIFVSIALGKISFSGQDYYLLSLSSPIIRKFIGKRVDELVNFNGQEYKIIAIV
ncbi:3-oxoacyl-ACP synthase [Ancylomarina longa]|uniref:3-oxoacyl-ACP synthase n=1 Tax=Ancylomarina longa TaxID=2487017 RepID=A0A434AZ29_9BACT|nr:3-oxoacyl-ACP synthase [Ancylomarina longa]RUT79873.1 3-oxoacyl-ACP synthase [Ancylomarina longa]